MGDFAKSRNLLSCFLKLIRVSLELVSKIGFWEEHGFSFEPALSDPEGNEEKPEGAVENRCRRGFSR